MRLPGLAPRGAHICRYRRRSTGGHGARRVVPELQSYASGATAFARLPEPALCSRQTLSDRSAGRPAQQQAGRSLLGENFIATADRASNGGPEHAKQGPVGNVRLARVPTLGRSQGGGAPSPGLVAACDGLVLFSQVFFSAESLQGAASPRGCPASRFRVVRPSLPAPLRAPDAPEGFTTPSDRLGSRMGETAGQRGGDR